jgi:hypothetical protein
MLPSEIRLKGVDWIHLAEYKNQWRAPFEHGNDTFRSTKKREIFWPAEQLQIFDEATYTVTLSSLQLCSVGQEPL